MKTLKFIYIFIVALLGSALTSCIEDGITTSPSAQPQFSVDTLNLGDLFTLGPSPTAKFVVYNRNDKGISLSSVRFRDDAKGIFRLNVDGMSGTDFSNVEIRANDSIYIFVEATLPENGKHTAINYMSYIDVTTNGVTQSVPVRASGRDVTRLKAYRINHSQTFSAEKPYQIFDSLVVDPSVTLTIPAGAELFMHSKAEIIVYGTLNIAGTAAKPVNITGDRSGFVAADIPYEIMSGQWGGITFKPTSKGNTISHASIRNPEYGVVVDNVPWTAQRPSLSIDNSVVRNSKGFVLQAGNSYLKAVNCELADASAGLLYLYGGKTEVNHCTLANFYLFTAAGPAVILDHTGAAAANDPDKVNPPLIADFSNTIFYGNGTEVLHYRYKDKEGENMIADNDLKGVDVMFARCLLKSKGEDDQQFINCLWDTDPLFYTVREDYYFDYRLKPDSPALGAADPALTLEAARYYDLLGTPRPATPSLGAYETNPDAEASPE